MTDIEKKLVAFAQWVIAEHRCAFGDVDGGSIQDKLEELGILQPVRVSEPCGEFCMCVEYEAEFPTDCLRLVDGVKEGG